MTKETIQNIIHMRLAVYQAGVEAGAWPSLDVDNAKGMMDYLFPKSGTLATYNLVVEAMRREHHDVTGGVYTLYKLPAQIEKEIIDYLKSEPIDMSAYLADAKSYLASMDTIATDHSMSFIRIGSFNVAEVDNLLRLCASHYRYSFEQKIQAYPYMD